MRTKNILLIHRSCSICLDNLSELEVEINLAKKKYVGSTIPPFNNAENGLYVHIIPQPEGDTIIVRIPYDDTKTKGYKNILIDAATYNEDYFNAIRTTYKITEFDYVFITHAHYDHYLGIKEILESFKLSATGEIWRPNPNKDAFTFLSYKEFDDYLTNDPKFKGKLRFYPENKPRKSIVLGIDRGKEIRLKFFGPDKEFIDGLKNKKRVNQNNTSLVFSIEYLNSRILFPGDAEWKEWERIDPDSIGHDYVFMKLSHHGSNTGFPEQKTTNKGKTWGIHLAEGFAIATWHPTFHKKQLESVEGITDDIPPKSEELDCLYDYYKITRAFVDSVNHDIRNYKYRNIPTQYIYALVPPENMEGKVDVIALKLFTSTSFLNLGTTPDIERSKLTQEGYKGNIESLEFRFYIEPTISSPKKKSVGSSAKTDVVIIRWRDYERIHEITN